jgi:hypothetical protein
MQIGATMKRVYDQREKSGKQDSLPKAIGAGTTGLIGELPFFDTFGKQARDIMENRYGDFIKDYGFGYIQPDIKKAYFTKDKKSSSIMEDGTFTDEYVKVLKKNGMSDEEIKAAEDESKQAKLDAKSGKSQNEDIKEEPIDNEFSIKKKKK